MRDRFLPMGTDARPRLWLRAGLAGLLALALSACASSPQRTAPSGGTVNVSGSGGALSAPAQAQALKRLEGEGREDLLALHLQTLASTGDADLVRGNRTRLLVDGPATFTAMKAAIRSARGRVLLQSYIVEDSGVAAEVADLLLARAAEGVKVSLIYDAVGSIATPEVFFQRLRDGGVSVCSFNPINPGVAARRQSRGAITHRDHRKLLVVDEEVAFTGGINISRVYSSGSSSLLRRGRADATALEDGWRDTQIEMRGPVVPVLAQVFEASWAEQRCEGDLGTAARAIGPREPGQRVVKVIPSDPRDESNRIYSVLLSAVDAARQSVRITMAYFAPGDEFVSALRRAARRGVAVELVLPGRSDSVLAWHAGRAYYDGLLEAGVRIHEMEHAVMHAKTAVIDGVVSTVGSSNLDWWSIVSNSELNVVVLGDDFGAEMQALFERDRAASVPITLQAWRQRGLGDRTMEGVGRLLERWL